jgi:hypothetical protein
MKTKKKSSMVQRPSISAFGAEDSGSNPDRAIENDKHQQIIAIICWVTAAIIFGMVIGYLIFTGNWISKDVPVLNNPQNACNILTIIESTEAQAFCNSSGYAIGLFVIYDCGKQSVLCDKFENGSIVRTLYPVNKFNDTIKCWNK